MATTIVEAPPLRGGVNVPHRDADGIVRHANRRAVRTAYMPADVRYWKAKREKDAKREQRDERPQLAKQAKHRRHARVRTIS